MQVASVKRADEVAATIEHHTRQMQRYGFTIIPNVIPRSDVPEVAANVLRAEREFADLTMEQIGDGVGRSSIRKDLQELAQEALARRGFLPDGKTPRSVEQHNALLDEIATELRDTYGLTDGYSDGTPTGNINPGINHIAHYPELASYLADSRVLGVAKAMMDPHVRIAQLELPKTNYPAPPEQLKLGWESAVGIIQIGHMISTTLLVDISPNHSQT